MSKLDREIIQIMSRHGDLKEKDLEDLLEAHVKPDQRAWQQFLKILLLILGIGFFVSGVLFFFAYNWDSLHKFVKIGIMEVLIVGAMVPVLFTKISPIVKNSLLSAASVLVGVMYAVFGQVYQTGANAYDFFLAWTVFIAVWTFVANFPVLWLIFISLVNITLAMYILQVAREIPVENVMLVFFLINASAIVLFQVFQHYFKWVLFPKWLEVFIALFAFIASTFGITYGIHDEKPSLFVLLILFVMIGYSAAAWNAYRQKRVFYLAMIALSLIEFGTSLAFRISDTQGMFLAVSLFIVASVTGSIFFLIHTHKRWNHVE
jgi:uncharacterized membrane protein